MKSTQERTLVALIVDDNPVDKTAYRRCLERDPDGTWVIHEVSTGEEAIARCQREALDVVVLDFNLPGMNGLELIRSLTADPESRPALVLMTGAGSERLATDAIKAGAQDYLVKDAVSPERLRRSLRAAIDQMELTRAADAQRRRIEAAEREAREALAVRDEFFAMATHDLRNPLQLISLAAQSIRRQLTSQGMDERLQARLDSIDSASRRMRELIDEFLKTYRTDAEAADGSASGTDLRELVETKLAALEPVYVEHRFKLSTEGENFWGPWDSRDIARLFDNLVGNAIKYSPKGGEVTVTLREAPLTAAGRDTPGVVLEVQDQGIGIPEEDLPHVFDRFRRGANVEELAGSGIGLAGVRQMLDAQGGTVSVRSRVGEGSTFIAHLPKRA